MLSHRSGSPNSIRWVLPVVVFAIACVAMLAGTWSPGAADAQRMPTPTPTMVPVINQPIQPLLTPVPTIRPVLTPIPVIPTEAPPTTVPPTREPPLGVPTPTPEPRPTEPPVEEETPQPTDEVEAPPATSEPLEVDIPREVTIQKYACPQGANLNMNQQDFDYWLFMCQENPGPVTFSLNAVINNTSYGSQTTPDDPNVVNKVIFDTITREDLTLFEQSVYGFSDAVAFCDLGDVSTELVPLTRTKSQQGTTFNIPATEESGDTVCVVFNIRADPTDLIIQKWQCPSGFDVNSLFADPKEDCIALMPGVTFKLEDANGIPTGIEATTDPSGVAVFDDIPSGPFRLAEVMPPGIASAFLFDCAQTDPNGNIDSLPPPNPIQLSFVAEFNLPANATTACNWYNIPEPNGTVVVHKWECPLGYEPDPAVSDPRNDCTVALDGVTFSLYTTTSPVRTRTTGDDGSGTAIFTGVDQSTFVLHEQVPPQIEETFYYYCERQYADGSVATYYDGDYVSMGDGMVSELQLGETFTCNWFNTPVNPDHNTIQIQAHFCSNGSPTNIDFATYDLLCTGLMPDLKFTFIYPNNTGFATMFGDMQGNYHFTYDVANETFGIKQENSPYLLDPVVFCFSQDVTTGASGPFGAQGDTVNHSFSTVSGNSLICHWFYIQPPRTSASLIKYVCPPGTAKGAAALYYQSECPESNQEFTFTLTDADGNATAETDTSGFGWDDLPPGPFTIEEAIPPGFLEPEVFCELTLNADGQGVETGYANGVVEGEIPPDIEARFYCRWYNIPIDPETVNTVYLVKQLCPPGTASGLTTVEYEVTCTITTGGFDFSVNGAAPDIDDGTGFYTWFDVGGDELTIQETLLPGFLEPEIFCDMVEISSGSSQLAEPAAVDGAFSTKFPADAGYRLICVYYNLPEDNGDNTIMITKYECPPGTESDPGLGLGHFFNACQVSVNPFTFDIADSNGLTSTPPGNGGLYEVTGVPAGPFSIQEDIPPDFGTPVVFCSLVDANNAVLNEYEFAPATGYVDGEFPANAADYRYGCDWFNITGGPGDVTIHKWTCPPGYDLNAPNADPLLDCTEITNGIEFGLDGPSGQQSGVTGDAGNGAVSFGNLDPGDYTITEAVPLDAEQVFVLDCVGLSDGSVHPVPLSTGGTLTIAVTADDSIVCNWFNVPGDDGSGDDLTVIKYWCDTGKFVSTANCEVYEDGVTIDLIAWNGSDWLVTDTRITDSSGTITWSNLTPGEYWLDEHNLNWCAIQTTSFNPDKDAFVVEAGKATVVRLYNCGFDPGDEGTPGNDDLPTKYPNTGVPNTGVPNTGVDPAGAGRENQAPSHLPMIAGLLGLALLVSLRRNIFFR